MSSDSECEVSYVSSTQRRRSLRLAKRRESDSMPAEDAPGARSGSAKQQKSNPMPADKAPLKKKKLTKKDLAKQKESNPMPADNAPLTKNEMAKKEESNPMPTDDAPLTKKEFTKKELVKPEKSNPMPSEDIPQTRRGLAKRQELNPMPDENAPQTRRGLAKRQESDPTPDENAPQTRRGLAKRQESDPLPADDVPHLSENSIYTNKVSRQWGHSSGFVKKVQSKNPVSSNKEITEMKHGLEHATSQSTTSAPDEDSSTIKDPTPPATPQPKKRKTNRMKKDVQSAFRTLQTMKRNMDDSDDVLIVETEPLQPIENRAIPVKIRLPSGVKKFQIGPTESFAKVFASIAESENVDENDIFMFVNDSTINIYDSPSAYGITIADILDCHIRSNKDCLPKVSTESAVEDKMLIYLNLQMKDSKSKTRLSIRTDQPMEKLMREFCNLTGEKFGSLQFYFDGEKIALSSTPDLIDLETDFCIDVLKSA